MLPYFEWHQINLGPITIQIWGLLVALGFMCAIAWSYWLARKYFLSEQVILDMALWAIMGGFVFARLFFVFFYSLDYFYQYPIDIFKIWLGGASSFGGFFGAGIAIYFFAKLRHFSWKELSPYIDITAFGLWLGWGVGRIGCFLIHDHPGRLSDFWLAVNFPAGARHDLGLYDSLLAFGIFIFLLLFFKKIVKRGWGSIVFLTFGIYAFVRFWLDFLRARDLPVIDVRYWYLTPMQWGILLGFGLLTFWLLWRKIGQSKNGRIA